MDHNDFERLFRENGVLATVLPTTPTSQNEPVTSFVGKLCKELFWFRFLHGSWFLIVGKKNTYHPVLVRVFASIIGCEDQEPTQLPDDDIYPDHKIFQWKVETVV